MPFLPHVRIHMLSPNGPSKLGKVEAGSLLSLRIHLPKGGPGCQTQDSATGTSPTWPLASDWVTTPRSPRTSVPATSIKRTLLSNPEGPRKGACSGQHATHCWQTAGGYCPRTMHPNGMWMRVANPLPRLLNHPFRSKLVGPAMQLRAMRQALEMDPLYSQWL